MTDQEFSPLTIQLAKGLADRIPDKRKAAALEVERMVRHWVEQRDFSQLKDLLGILQKSFTQSANPNARKGGLLGLAATAVALGRESVSVNLPELVPPVVACFADPDPKVRYMACEALFNIVKIARGSSLIFFKDIFNAIAKLYGDSDVNVRTCAEALNKLLMDVVRENPHFDVEVFISLLRTHLYTSKALTRQMLVSWLAQLQRTTLISLLEHLPEFLDGLFQIVGDPNPEISKMAEAVLGEFVSGLKKARVSTERYCDMVNILVVHSQSDNGTIQYIALLWISLFLEQAGRALLPFLSNMLIPVLPCVAYGSDKEAIKSVAASVSNVLRDLVTSEDDNDIDAPVRIMVEATVEEQDTLEEAPLEEIPDHSPPPRVVTPEAGARLELTSDQAAFHAETASPDLEEAELEAGLQTPPGSLDTSVKVADGDSTLQSGDRPKVAQSDEWVEVGVVPKSRSVPKKILLMKDTREGLSPALNLPAVLEVLLQHAHYTVMEIRIEALKWLLWLQEKIPKRVYRLGAVILESVMDILNDSSEKVIFLALRLVCVLSTSSAGLEIEAETASKTEADSQAVVVGGATTVGGVTEPSYQKVTSYFSEFLMRLLKMFSKDSTLLATRGSFIIRHLCLVVEPRCVYCTLAGILKVEADLQFASTMVQHLNLILFTSVELFEMRMQLRDLTTEEDWQLFGLLYCCWCHNAPATIALCLLTQNYQHVSDLIDNFSDIDVTASLLGELDRLVQLIESPIFTFLRLQILDPCQYPDLVRALYGILMLLPQSTAFFSLQQRLSCVPALSAVQGHQDKRRGRKEKRVPREINFPEMVEHFNVVQRQHYMFARNQHSHTLHTNVTQ